MELERDVGEDMPCLDVFTDLFFLFDDGGRDTGCSARLSLFSSIYLLLPIPIR